MITEIVRHTPSDYVIYLEDRDVKNRLNEWLKCRCIATHFYQSKVIGWEFKFPASLYSRIAKLTGLPVKTKNPNRRQQGLIMAERNRQHQFKG